MDPNPVRPGWKMPLSGGLGLAERKTKKTARWDGGGKRAEQARLFCL
jgi:hypothetical protein